MGGEEKEGIEKREGDRRRRDGGRKEEKICSISNHQHHHHPCVVVIHAPQSGTGAVLAYVVLWDYSPCPHALLAGFWASVL